MFSGDQDLCSFHGSQSGSQHGSCLNSSIFPWTFSNKRRSNLVQQTEDKRPTNHWSYLGLCLVSNANNFTPTDFLFRQAHRYNCNFRRYCCWSRSSTVNHEQQKKLPRAKARAEVTAEVAVSTVGPLGGRPAALVKQAREFMFMRPRNCRRLLTYYRWERRA